MLRMLMSLAEFESGIISSRIIDGLAAKKRRK
jgi:DNA invertase Pin-like site-specific DNA recombinase